MDNKIREFNKRLKELGYFVCKAAWANDCLDIYSMNDESGIPEKADQTVEEVENFINELDK